jgi:hypothetical protein
LVLILPEYRLDPYWVFGAIVYGILCIPFALLTTAAGIYALLQRMWWLALACLVVPILYQIMRIPYRWFNPYAPFIEVVRSSSYATTSSDVTTIIIGIIIPLAAVVLLVLSRAEFRRGKLPKVKVARGLPEVIPTDDGLPKLTNEQRESKLRKIREELEQAAEERKGQDKGPPEVEIQP